MLNELLGAVVETVSCDENVKAELQRQLSTSPSPQRAFFFSGAAASPQLDASPKLAETKQEQESPRPSSPSNAA